MIRQIFPLALISSLRFFGLFIVLPVIGLYADEFHTSAFLAGLAAGGYALTQIFFQTPFGVWSDKYNRKHIVGIGLIVFLLGSLVCAFADRFGEWSIYVLIFGRFLQGAGAVGGVVSAQIADLVREEERNKAMAIMGGGIFISFVLAMLLSPIVASHFGLNALFLITSALCVLSLIILYWKVPNTPSVRYHYTQNDLGALLKDKNLLMMNLSAFLQKFLMIFAFVCVSLGLTHHFKMAEGDLWQVYVPAALVGVLAMGPSSVFAQKKGQFKGVMLFGIFAFVVAYFLMAFAHDSLLLFGAGVLVFFVGFALQEPLMQSLASRYPKAHQKGAALGIFTTLGYAGSALGGMCGGFLYEQIGLFNLSFIIAAVCVAWAIMLWLFLSNPKHHKNLYIPLGELAHSEVLKRLDKVDGVIEWYINQTQAVAIVKYDDTRAEGDSILAVLKVGA